MDSATEQRIQRNIDLYFEANGVRETFRDIQSLVKALEQMGIAARSDAAAMNVVKNALTSAGASVKQVDNAFEKLNSSTDKAGRGMKTFGGVTQGLENTLHRASGAMRSFSDLFNGLGGLAGAGASVGLGAGVKYLNDFNKSLLTGSGSWMKYNVGVTNFEYGMRRIGVATKLTQTETLGLLASYEKGFNTPSLKNAEALFKNIRNAVGANKEAMQGMLQTLSGIVSKYPDLEKSVTRLNSSDKQRLSLINQQSVLLGNMSLQEAKAFQDYIQNNKQAADADKKRKDEVQSQIDAMQDIKKVLEEISMEIGKTLMPYLKEVADFMREAKGTLLGWVPAITKVAAAFAGLMMILAPIGRTMQLLRGGMNLLGMGGRGAGGAAGGRSLLGGVVSRASVGRNWIPTLSPRVGGNAWTGMGYVRGAMSGELRAAPALARGAGNLLKTSGGVGIVAAVAALGAGMYENKKRNNAAEARKRGDYGEARSEEKKANIAGVTKNVAGVVGYAATGAMIGSLIPVIGTAVGAIAGTVVGLAVEGKELWKNLTAVGKDWFGISQSSKVAAAANSDAYKEAAGYATEIKNEMKTASALAAQFGSEAEKRAAASADDAINTSENTSNAIISRRQGDDDGTEKTYAEATGDRTGKAMVARNEEVFKSAMSDQDRVLETAKKNGDELAVAMAEATKQVLTATKEFNEGKADDTTSDADMRYLADQLKTAKDALGDNQRKQQDAYKQAQVNVAGKAEQQKAMANSRVRDEAYGNELSTMVRSGGNIDVLGQYEKNAQDLRSVSSVSVNTSKDITDADRSAINQYGGSKASAASSENVTLGQKDDISDVMAVLDAKKKEQETQLATTKDANEQKVISKSIAEIDQAIAATKTVQRKVQDEIVVRIGDVDAKNGYILAAMNEQKMILESQNKLYDAQAGLVDTIIQNMSMTGDINLGTALDSVKAANGILEQSAKTLQQSIAVGEAQQQAIRQKTISEFASDLADVGINQEAFVKMKVNPDELATAAKALAEKASAASADGRTEDAERLMGASKAVNGSLVSQNEQQASLVKLQGMLNSKKQQELDTALKVKEIYSGQLELAQTQTEYAQQQVDLMDSLGVGLRASVDARMQVVSALQQEQAVLQQQRQANAEALKLAGSDIEQSARAKAAMLKTDIAITANIKKQADMTKTLRDGYISAIQSATTGSGIFAKIMVDQTKNLGVGVKFLNVLSSKSSGGLSGGKQQAAQFTADGGLNYGDESAAGYRLHDGSMSNQDYGRDVTQAFRDKLPDNYNPTTGAVTGNPNMLGAAMAGGGVANQPTMPLGTAAQPGATPPASPQAVPQAVQAADRQVVLLTEIRDLLQRLNNPTPHGSGGIIRHARGGMVNGPSHAGGGVKFNAGGKVHELEGGEAVINKRSTEKHAGLLSAINEDGGGKKFANGGILKYALGGVVDARMSTKAERKATADAQDAFDQKNDPAGFASRQQEKAARAESRARVKAANEATAAKAAREQLAEKGGDVGSAIGSVFGSTGSLVGNFLGRSLAGLGADAMSDKGAIATAKKLADAEKSEKKRRSGAANADAYRDMYGVQQNVTLDTSGVPIKNGQKERPTGPKAPTKADPVTVTPPPAPPQPPKVPQIAESELNVLRQAIADDTTKMDGASRGWYNVLHRDDKEQGTMAWQWRQWTHNANRLRDIATAQVTDNMNIGENEMIGEDIPQRLQIMDAMKKTYFDSKKDREDKRAALAVAEEKFNAQQAESKKQEEETYKKLIPLSQKSGSSIGELQVGMAIQSDVDNGLGVQKYDSLEKPYKDALLVLSKAGMIKDSTLKSIGAPIEVAAKHAFGGIIPKFAAGGVMPDMGASQNPIKSILQSMMPQSNVGDKTIAAFDPGSEIVRNKDIMSSLSNARTSRDIPSSYSPSRGSGDGESSGGGTTSTVSIENVTVKVEMGELGRLGGMVKDEIEKALQNVARTIRGGKDSTLTRGL